MKEKVFLQVSKWSLERRMGWETWSLQRAASRSEISGGLERRRDKTVMPVPPGTALHQLYSVPPAGLTLGSGVLGVGFWSNSDIVLDGFGFGKKTKEGYNFEWMRNEECTLLIVRKVF